MASVADIVNMAIGKLGLRSFIGAIDDATPEAETASVFYESCRDSLLQAFPWSFAQRRATLAAISGTTHTGWGYAFLVPEDALAVNKIESGYRNPSPDQLVRFAVEYEPTLSRRILLSDIIQPELVYTTRITNTEIYSPLFVDTLAWRLAEEMSHPLTGRAELRQAMHEGYKMALTEAIRADSVEREVDRPPESEFITVRT